MYLGVSNKIQGGRINMFAVEDFDLNVDYDLLGARNGVRAVIEDVVTSLADDGIGFTFGQKVHPKQVNLLKLRDADGETASLGEYLMGEFKDECGPCIC